MILVTVGTHEAPFDRLLEAVATLPAGEEIVVQHGPSRVRPPNATCVPYVSYEELAELVERARVVVSHAGVGSIATALARGKKPIVVPRTRAHGEHVDDHQLELCRRLAREGLVVLVEDERDLARAIAEHDGAPPTALSRRGTLASELRSLLRSRLAARPAGR